MYNLCMLKMNECDSVTGHPMSVILRSDNLGEISDKIIERVADGCPEHALMVYREVGYRVTYRVEYAEGNQPMDRCCRTCEYWLEKYWECENPEQRADDSGTYGAPPDQSCDLWEPNEKEA